MINVQCATCGVVFGMPDELVARRKEDHKRFVCPNSHPNIYPGPTPQEKEIADLRARLELLARKHSERFHDLLTQREEAQLAAKTCPLCGEPVARRLRVRENIVIRLAEHLRDEHGAVARRRALPRGST